MWFQGKTSQEEAELVASYIKTLINKKIIQRYSDVGILFRSVGYHATEYINIFERENIISKKCHIFSVSQKKNFLREKMEFSEISFSGSKNFFFVREP